MRHKNTIQSQGIDIQDGSEPAMLYTMETLLLTTEQYRKLEMAEMKMCRWTCGQHKKDVLKHEEIREYIWEM